MLDRTLEITHADLVEAKNLCEALRVENEDYKVCFSFEILLKNKSLNFLEYI
jgi:hypothetical protein